MPVIMLEGNGSFENRGCEAIHAATVQILRDVLGPCRILNCPANIQLRQGYHESDPDVEHLLPEHLRRFSKDWFNRQLRRTLLRQDWRTFQKHLPRADIVLAVGGDNYSLDYGLPGMRFSTNDTIMRAGRPLVIWGASIGPFNREPDFERTVAMKLKGVDLICARETETVTYLESLGVKDNVRLMADPAFLLEPRETDLPNEVAKLLRDGCLGVNLSPIISRYRSSDQPWPELAIECVRAILKNLDLNILLIPHVISAGNDDHAFLSEVANRLSEYAGRLAVVGKEYDCHQYKWIISQLHMFIGARTHSTIAALSSRVPTISLGYSLKARGINKDIFGDCRWLVTSEELTPDLIVEKARQLEADRNQVAETLDAMMPDYSRRAEEGARHLIDLLEQNHGRR